MCCYKAAKLLHFKPASLCVVRHTAAVIPDDWDKECGRTANGGTGSATHDSRGVNKGYYTIHISVVMLLYVHLFISEQS